MFAIVIAQDSSQSPKAEQAQKELEIEFHEIAPLPNSTLVDYDSSRKTSQALVDASYLTSVRSVDILKHYDEQLKMRGWQSYGTSGMTDWGRDLGGKSAYYCKGEYYSQLQYAGEKANYGWTYAFSMSWGLSNCETKPEGGWVKQTVFVSLMFMAFGNFLVTYTIDTGKHAWSKNASEYAKWVRERSPLGTAWFDLRSEASHLWNDRIISLVGAPLGLFLLWLGAYSLWRNIFGG